VVFQLPKEVTKGAKSVVVLGDFNNWEVDKTHQLKAKKDGSFETILTLDTGKDYHFRYLIDGNRWENDWNADKYETSPLHPHISNSCLCLTAKAEKDNLTKVEGIGPKIAGLLNDANITTFEKLAGTDVGALKGILAAAGKRYQMHDPSSWAAQADLAGQGKWDALKKWQDELKGGKIA